MNSTIVMEEVTDEKELAEAQLRREFYDRNFAWFQLNSNKIYRKYRGKCIAVAGEELFVADTMPEVWQLAETKYPKDKGIFAHYIFKEKAIRIYGNWR